ncbi:hypothetical protein GCM10010331_44560 [Streptomyces xanthochromogenes]|uniref:hypothetical protein n=1 Tax=Streptomyces xanthochromogenes TaxID=67384 RepID=UPI001679C5B0|nr:hypothetical protein [Streptomyces xanthochromogenes]GHB52084.1 hypothetical protein GCM10010331_44560 [Streptomyces xanthochromogenes]
MTAKLCQFCDDNTPAVARVFFAWTTRSDGTRQEADKVLCAPHMRSKRDEFTNGSEDGPMDPAFEVLEEFDEALEAVASGQWDEELKYAHESGVRFVWSHGPYIDVFMTGSDSSPAHALNVYDYAKGAPTISTYEEFKAECDEWLDGLDDHDLMGYTEESWFQNRKRRG